MRSRSLARVVIASLGVAVVITLGCGKSPGGPSEQTSFSVRSISPTDGSIAATVARIAGTGFQSGATVTVDGSRVDATVLSATTISLAMPAHAAGKVNVTVTNQPSQEQASVPGGYRYFGPPVISELFPNIGSTAGGVPITIRGTGFVSIIAEGFTVTFDGILSTINDTDYDTELYLRTPAHTAGTVEVIVTDRYGQKGSGVFTYASPATFDVNGDWEGSADAFFPEWGARVVLTIRDNLAVSVLCSVCRDGICSIVGAPSLTLDPPPVVANGEFSFVGSGGVSITGKILSPNYMSGSLNLTSCGSRQWSAYKK